MSGRAKRVLIYTISLLVAPMPLMPFVKGTREYIFAMTACGAILTLSSFYVVRGELKVKHRLLIGNKLLITSLIMLVFGITLFLGSLLFLIRAN